MGLIVDSTVLVGAEREGLTVPDTLLKIRKAFGETPVALSVMSAIELVHGIWHAERPEVRARREEFVEDVFTRIPVYPVSLHVGRIAGRVDAESRSKGVTIPTADLLIGATALALGFTVATSNVRHFKLLPKLKVFLLK